MKNKMKIFVLVLAVALVAVAATGVLVACNGNDGESGEQAASVCISQKQYDALTGFLYSAAVASDSDMSLTIEYFSPAACEDEKLDEEDELPEGGFALATLEFVGESFDFDGNIVRPRGKAYICYFASAKAASDNFEKVKAMYDGNKNGYCFTTRVGNVVVAETEEGFFANTVMRAVMPSDVDDLQKQLVQNAYDKMSDSFSASGEFERKAGTMSAAHSVSMSFAVKPAHGNRDIAMGFSNYTSYTRPDIEAAEQNFRDDEERYSSVSYFNIETADSFAYWFMQKRAGFVYERISSSTTYSHLGKWRIVDYLSDGDVEERLVIPSVHEGIAVMEVGAITLSAKHISISEGVETVTKLTDDELVEIDIPESLQAMTLYSKSIQSISFAETLIDLNLQCASLTEINYDGYSSDFTYIYGDSKVQSWCHVYDGVDSETGRDVYIDIDLTVHCYNRDLHYSSEDLPGYWY